MLLDLGTRERLVYGPLGVKEGGVRTVAFSPDCQIVAAGYSEYNGAGGSVNGVVLWHVAARKRLLDKPLPVTEGDVRCLAFSPNGKTIAVGYVNSTRGDGVATWDVATGNRLVDYPLPPNELGLTSVDFSPDGKTIAAGIFRGVVLWDAATRKRLFHEPLHAKEGGVETVSFSPDGRTVLAEVSGMYVSSSGEGRAGVVRWDVATGIRRGSEQPLVIREGVTSVALSANGGVIAAGYTDGVELWDVAARKQLVREPLAVEAGYSYRVAFSPDGRTLATGFSSNRGVGGVVLWDVATRRRFVAEPFFSEKGAQVGSVSFSPDGATIAVGYGLPGHGGGLLLWDVSLESLAAPRPPNRQSELHPEGMARVFPRPAIPRDVSRPPGSRGSTKAVMASPDDREATKQRWLADSRGLECRAKASKPSGRRFAGESQPIVEERGRIQFSPIIPTARRFPTSRFPRKQHGTEAIDAHRVAGRIARRYHFFQQELRYDQHKSKGQADRWSGVDG